jgi:hypothetical protein
MPAAAYRVHELNVNAFRSRGEHRKILMKQYVIDLRGRKDSPQAAMALFARV